MAKGKKVQTPEAPEVVSFRFKGVPGSGIGQVGGPYSPGDIITATGPIIALLRRCDSVDEITDVNEITDAGNGGEMEG